MSTYNGRTGNFTPPRRVPYQSKEFTKFLEFFQNPANTPWHPPSNRAGADERITPDEQRTRGRRRVVAGRPPSLRGGSVALCAADRGRRRSCARRRAGDLSQAVAEGPRRAGRASGGMAVYRLSEPGGGRAAK